jgi:hypothetical protein
MLDFAEQTVIDPILRGLDKQWWFHLNGTTPARPR